MDTLQTRLAALRRAAGLTQAEAAKRLSRHPITIAKWEDRSGRFRPTLAHLEALASLYGVTLGALLDNPPVLGRWARDHFQKLGSLGPPTGQSIDCPATATDAPHRSEILALDAQVVEEFATVQPAHWAALNRPPIEDQVAEEFASLQPE